MTQTTIALFIVFALTLWCMHRVGQVHPDKKDWTDSSRNIYLSACFILACIAELMARKEGVASIDILSFFFYGISFLGIIVFGPQIFMRRADAATVVPAP